MKKGVGNFDELIVETCDDTDLNMGVAVVYLYRYVIFEMIDKIAMLSQLSVVFAQARSPSWDDEIIDVNTIRISLS